MRFILYLTLLLFPIMSIAQKVTVTADKMNELYKGCSNPLTIVVENHSCDEIIAKSDNGTLTGSDCTYNYFNYDSTSHYAKIFVGIKKDSLIDWVDTISFRLKNIPLPTAIFANQTREISKDLFLGTSDLYLGYKGIDGGIIYYIIKMFSVKITRNDSIIFEENNINGFKISPTVFKFVKFNCSTGDIILFHDIIVIGPDKTKSEINEIQLTLK